MNSDNDSVWRELSLGEAAKITMGQSPPSSTYNTEGFGLPFYQGKAEFGFRYPVVEKWCSEPQRIAEAGSVLVSVRAPVGDVNIADTRCCIGRGLAAVSGLADTSVTDYLYFYLQYHKAAIESKGTGSTFKAINKGTLHDFFVLLPPLPEQRRIAAVLNAIQEAIAAQEDVIAAARHFKRSLMQRLFTYGPGREPAPTKETEIGEIPAHWEVVNIEGIKAPTKGAIVSGPFGSSIGKRFFVERGIPVIRGGNLTKGTERFKDEGFVYLTEEKAKEFSNCEAVADDIVFTAAGTIGQVGIIPRDSRYPKYIISNKQLRVRVNTELAMPNFLYYWFTGPVVQSEIQEQQRGTSIPVINLSILRALPVLLPSLDEQKQIADAIFVADAKIAAEEDRKTALDTLFKSMLHQLMTGQIRLLADEGLPLPKN